ncbi:MAG: methionyl-tRNA formyltransferase [Acutalibacteraceae bacterium]
MKIVFMGTPEFAVPCLARLLEDGHIVSLVVTQADKPKGRGHRLMPPPVKAFALEHGLPVFQPQSMKTPETLERLREAAPELIVVVAYGKILPPAVLELPPHGCINVHASLLPRYRGAAPIQWAVLNGETEAGVTTMQMNAGLDTGDMLLSASCPVPEDMTAGQLHDRLSVLGAQVLSDTLDALKANALTAKKQNDDESCYAPMLDKSLSPLDWSRPAAQLHNQVRGLNPWPSACCRCQGRLLKVHISRVGESSDAEPGIVIKLNPFTVSCGGHTSLELLEVQGEGARRMAGADFLRGHPLAAGTRLEDAAGQTENRP